MRLAVQHLRALRFLASGGDRAVVVDAALEDGGGGTALSAPQLFAAAVGACILEFVVNSCRLREIELESVSLEMECEEQRKPRRLGRMEATLHVEPRLPEDVQRRLIGVAKQATLVSTLRRPPEVAVRFA